MAGITYPYGDTSAGTTKMDALLSTTLMNYHKKGKMQDAIFSSNPTFYFLKDKVRKESGGYKIATNLMYGQNTTVGSYSRYEVLDISPQDGMTQAYYPWAQYSGAISIDGLSEFQNSGVGKLLSLLGEKVEQTTMTFAEKMNNHLWDVENVTIDTTSSSANGGKNIISIPMIVPLDPTSDCELGGINGATYTWWASNVLDYGATHSAVVFKYNMSNMYNTCTKGTGGQPDVVIMDQASWENYESALDPQIRYTDQKVASAGFYNLRYKNALVMWDEHMCDIAATANYDGSFTDGSIFFLNTKFLKLVVGKGKDFAPTKFQQPEDQDARTAKYLFYGQLVCSNRRKHGVIQDVTDTAFTS